MPKDPRGQLDPAVIENIVAAFNERGTTLDALTIDEQTRFAGQMGVSLPALHNALSERSSTVDVSTRGAGSSSSKRKPSSLQTVTRACNDPGVLRAMEDVEAAFGLSATGERWERFDRVQATLATAERCTSGDRAFRAVRILRQDLRAATRAYSDRVARATAARGKVQAQREAVEAAR